MRTTFLILGAALVLSSCSPAKPTRIGPVVPKRPPDCGLEVFEDDDRPARPYRDIGMVTIDNCQDFTTPPCSRWLQKAACELGGTIVYPAEEGQHRSDGASYQGEGPGTVGARSMTAKIMVAAYASDLAVDEGTDPMMLSRSCDPPCEEGQKCVNRECVDSAEPCGEEPAPDPDDAAPQRCME